MLPNQGNRGYLQVGLHKSLQGCDTDLQYAHAVTVQAEQDASFTNIALLLPLFPELQHRWLSTHFSTEKGMGWGDFYAPQNDGCLPPY